MVAKHGICKKKLKKILIDNNYKLALINNAYVHGDREARSD